MAQTGSRSSTGAARKKKVEPRPPWRQRVRRFAFEGYPEKDRFGVFDPTIRGLFVVGLIFLMIMGAGSVFDAWGSGTRSVAAATAVMIAIAALGVLGYRRIWPTPAERELLLRMAAEDDEARRQRAERARARSSLRTAAEAQNSANGAQGDGNP